MFNWIMITCILTWIFRRKLKRERDRKRIRRSRIDSFTLSLCPPRITEEEPERGRCPEYNDIDDRPQIPYPEHKQPLKAGKLTGTRNQLMGDGHLGTYNTPGMNTPLKTASPIMETEQKPSRIGDVGVDSPWNGGGSAKYPGSFRHGENPWRSIRESEHRNYPYPMGIRKNGSTSTLRYTPDNTRRPRYSRLGTEEIPDIGTNAEKDRSKGGGGTNALSSNCQPCTPIRDRELKDNCPSLTCLGGESERNRWRHGREQPRLETCPGPNNQRRHDILRPHTTERAANKNPQMGSNRTEIRKITNGSNELVKNKVPRPGEGTYQSLIKILGIAPSLRISWKAQMIARRLTRLRAAQLASFEAGGFIWIN